MAESLKRILVVDDEENTRIALTRLLSREGYEVLTAANGLETVDPVGKAFDPERHQAMAVVDVDGAAPNSVVAVLQKGYVLNERLLRPALVNVAQAG